MILVGRSAECDVIVDSKKISRRHCCLALVRDELFVRDLGSTNGTTINGVMVERAYLAHNAVIGIGDSRLRFEVIGGDHAATLSAEHKWGRALGASPAMRRLFAILPKIAESDASILLEGETGTGKTLIASALHENSARAAGPFIVVDCGAIPPNLIESELFGHDKGAFTGATAARTGAFEAARGGTVFLDEIGELPLDMQPKLLRALEDRVVKPLGRNKPIPLDIRLVAATNRDLRAEINRGRFRSDLYYRLNTFHLRVPPLRERREDIPLLVAHYYEQLGAGEPPASLLVDFARHDWPGNVRELRAAIERTVLLDDPAVWRGISQDTSHDAAAPRDESLSFRAAKERAVAAWERDYVRSLIAQHEGNLSRAARAVRMDRNHLRELLLRHGLRAEDA
ncbi:MAG TPA: sigma 54-interacting transcriptional regulator, partial [Kofleriaceae bacterium]